MGSDDYAISHRFLQQPTQVLKIYYKDNNDTTSHKLTLD